MTDWFQARVRAHEVGAGHVRRTESLAIADATGRTLARDLLSIVPLPSHSSSAMDGWAVAGDPPWLVGPQIRAGDTPQADPLASGTARPIATGGPVPPGTWGVLRSEHGEKRDGLLRPNDLARVGEPRAGEHVRVLGEEIGVGEVLLTAGSRLTAPRLALAAASGHDAVEVAEVPTVDVVLFGSEIVGSGIPQPGGVRDAYSPQLPALLASMGLRLGLLRREPDYLETTVAAIRSSSAPLLISTGGTASGPTDHVRAALQALGAELAIDGVDMRPGHPVMLARLPVERSMLCLPGNPFAAMMVLATIGVALVDGMMGRPLSSLGHAPLAADIANAGKSTRLVAFRWTDDGAVPTDHQGTGMLRGIADANGVAVIPPGGADAGQLVRTVPLPW